MSNRVLVIVAATALLLLGGVAAWLLLLPPRGQATVAHSLSAANPAVGVRYTYDPALFQPQPYDGAAEFPLQLDAANWSFYGKRLRGAGKGYAKDVPPAVYSFLIDQYSSVYTEFYRLQPEEKAQNDRTQIAGQAAVRQRLKLMRGKDSRAWPVFFPRSVTGDSPEPLVSANELAENTFAIPEIQRIHERQQHEQSAKQPAAPAGPATAALLYSWALFKNEDLYLFQAVAPRELTAQEVAQAEEMISALEFGVETPGS